MTTVPIDGDVKRAEFIDETYYHLLSARKKTAGAADEAQSARDRQYDPIVA